MVEPVSYGVEYHHPQPLPAPNIHIQFTHIKNDQGRSDLPDEDLAVEE
jgi:hypothetical protein